MCAGAALLLLVCIGGGQAGYLGKEVGPLSELHHGVRGKLFAVDSRTVYLQDFHYDGVGPAAYFYVGTSKTPSATGALRLRDDRGGTAPLRRYRGESITLSLPDGKTLKDFTWFSVWCDDYAVNFGSVDIPRNLEFPKPAKVGALRGVHGVSSDPVVVVDAQTLLIPNFSYDGEAPDAKFWVGRGEKPSPQGIRIPDENGKETPLRKYDRKTIVLTLPGELTVFDIGHFAVWCEAFTVNFGHVVLPRNLLTNIPPSLKMLGVSPQSRNMALTRGQATPTPRSRKPLTRLDATTYRPTRLGAGPPASIEQPTVHAHLHRRDYQHTPSQQQLILDDQKQNQQEPNEQQQNQQYQNQQYHIAQALQQQQSLQFEQIPSEQTKNQNQQKILSDQQYTQYQQILLEQQHNQHQQIPSQQQLLSQQQQNQNHQHIASEQQQNQQYHQTLLDEQHQHPRYRLIPINQHIQNHQLQQQSQNFFQNPIQPSIDQETQQLLQQQQLYEQQKQALQQQLQQYQSLPFLHIESPDFIRSHRQIDLDLVEGSQ